MPGGNGSSPSWGPMSRGSYLDPPGVSLPGIWSSTSQPSQSGQGSMFLPCRGPCGVCRHLHFLPYGVSCWGGAERGFQHSLSGWQQACPTETFTSLSRWVPFCQRLMAVKSGRGAALQYQKHGTSHPRRPVLTDPGVGARYLLLPNPILPLHL